MRNTKIIVMSIMAVGLLFTTANARMMGDGKGMMCEKTGMMGKDGKPGMMSGTGKGIAAMGERGMMHGWFMKKGLHFYFSNREALGLTDDQLEKLHDIKVNFKKSFIMDKAKLEVAKIELEEQLDGDQVDMKAVKKKAKEISGLKETLLLAKVRTRVDAKKILNEEQRKKAKKLGHHIRKDKCMELKEKATGSQKKENEKHH